jgi:hypothetical protein
MDQGGSRPIEKGVQKANDPVPGNSAPTASLVVPYQAGMKVLVALCALLGLPAIHLILFTADDFVLHLLGVGAYVVVLLYLAECLATIGITLEPDRIIKRRLLLGDTVLPARWAVLTTDQHTIRFFHGSTLNRRERITIRLFMIPAGSACELFSYAEKTYQIHLNPLTSTGSGGEPLQGKGAGKGRAISALVLAEFKKTAQSYGLMQACLGFFAVVVVFIVGLSDSFEGVGGTLPVYWIRVAFILAALAAHPLLNRLSKPQASRNGFPPATFQQQVTKLADRSSYSALAAIMVGLLGFFLFFLSGNLLDFYLFLAIAYHFWADFYPRLSNWAQPTPGSQAATEAAAPHPPTTPMIRRRSLQISLVLMGTLAVSSYGETRHYLYKNRQDCLDDWNSDQDCKQPGSGSSHFGTGHYYGPRYSGRSAGLGMRSIGSVSVSRGGFGLLGGFHGSFGG